MIKNNFFFLIILISLVFLVQDNFLYSITPDEEMFLDAAAFGDEKDFKKMLKKNININVQDDVGNTALILAASEGHTVIVELLLKANADKTIVNKYGYDALYYAKNKKKRDIVKLLEN